MNRKKRKWDQPAEAIIAATASTPGLVPLSSGVALAGMTFPCMFPSLMGVYPTMPTSTASAQISLAFPTVQQNAAAIVQKINQVFGVTVLNVTVEKGNRRHDGLLILMFLWLVLSGSSSKRSGTSQ